MIMRQETMSTSLAPATLQSDYPRHKYVGEVAASVGEQLYLPKWTNGGYDLAPTGLQYGLEISNKLELHI
jgi:hypothetical protein